MLSGASLTARHPIGSPPGARADSDTDEAAEAAASLAAAAASAAFW